MFSILFYVHPIIVYLQYIAIILLFSDQCPAMFLLLKIGVWSVSDLYVMNW